MNDTNDKITIAVAAYDTNYYSGPARRAKKGLFFNNDYCGAVVGTNVGQIHENTYIFMTSIFIILNFLLLCLNATINFPDQDLFRKKLMAVSDKRQRGEFMKLCQTPSKNTSISYDIKYDYPINIGPTKVINPMKNYASFTDMMMMMMMV